MSHNKSTQRNEKIWVKIIRAGYIPQLGMQGPIPNPIQITRGIAHSMIVSGIDVFEVDPVTKNTKKLTIQNVFRTSGSNNVSDTSNQKPPQNSSTNKENKNQNSSISFNGVSNNNGQKNNKNNDKPKDHKNNDSSQSNNKTDKKEDSSSEKK